MQLIRTADGVPVWGRSYTVARTDLLTIEEQVSHQVADALRVQLRAAGTRPSAERAERPGRLRVISSGPRVVRELFRSQDARGDRELRAGAAARAGVRNGPRRPRDLACVVQRPLRLPEGRAGPGPRRAEEEAYRALALDHDLAEAHFAIASAAGTVYRKVQLAHGCSPRWTRR